MGIAKMKSGAHGRGGVGIDGFTWFGTGRLAEIAASPRFDYVGERFQKGVSNLILAVANCHHPRRSSLVYFCEIS